jgi:hypothetical protein
MIAKFICADTQSNIEFSLLNDLLLISATEEENEQNNVTLVLNKQELFELIGFLLRVQSELRK